MKYFQSAIVVVLMLCAGIASAQYQKTIEKADENTRQVITRLPEIKLQDLRKKRPKTLDITIHTMRLL